MEQFTKDLPFIVSLLGGVLVFQMVFDNKLTTQLLTLILFSMIVINHQKFKGLLERVRV